MYIESSPPMETFGSNSRKVTIMVADSPRMKNDFSFPAKRWSIFSDQESCGGGLDLPGFFFILKILSQWIGRFAAKFKDKFSDNQKN